MRRRYSTRQINFLREAYQHAQIPEVTALFNARFNTNKAQGTIKSTLSNHKITCGRTPGSPKGTFRAYTPEQATYLAEHYKQLSITDLTVAFNRHFGTSKTPSQIRAFTRNHRLKSGRTGHYQKGGKAWNTGTKGLTRANTTSFKRGNTPANAKPLGHERICTKDGYVLIKIAEANPYTGAPTRYKAKHIVTWEAQHGPVPKDHVIAFLDNDKTNCAINNLVCITKQEHLLLNRRQLHSLPQALKPTAIAMAKLETKISKLKTADIEE